MASVNERKDWRQRLREKPTVRPRLTTGEWQKVLLNDQDQIVINAKVYQLKAELIFSGVVEVFIPEFKEF